MNKKADKIFTQLEEQGIEVWADVVDYEGYYKVSNLGRIKRMARTIQLEEESFMILKEMILNPFDSDKGNGRIYKRIRLVNKQGLTHNKYLHILVAQAFIENYDTRLNVVNHIDNDRLNNNITNLEFCTQAHNVREYHRLHKKAK